MGITDKEEFKQRMSNLDAEEKKIVVKVIPDDLLLEELGRRLASSTDTLNQIKNVLKIQE